MKKLFTLVLLAFLLVPSSMHSTVLSSETTTTGDWSNGVTISKSNFSSLKAGDIISVTISELNSWNDSYWQVVLRQAGENDSWEQLSSFNGSVSATGVFRYVLTDTNVTEIKEGGLNITGKYITFSKVEWLTTSKVNISSTETPTGDYETNLQLTGDSKGSLGNAFMTDFIRVTYTATGDDAKIQISNSKWSSIANADQNTKNEAKTLDYFITSATALEDIQLYGVNVQGKNVTISSVDLYKVENRYNAADVTIGSDGIATWSSSKNLDFTSSGITPYYASSYTQGTVNLTAVENKTTWEYQGYILKGDAGTYEVPTTGNATWQETNYLIATSDYQTEVKASQSGDTKYRYIFAKEKNNSETIGFYKLTADHTLAAHKAYLETVTDITPAEKSGRRGIILDFGNGTTAILKVVDDGGARQIGNNDGKYYTLQGTSMQAPTKKGLYILNGKKVLVK